jgi:hypothetical protein
MSDTNTRGEWAGAANRLGTEAALEEPGSPAVLSVGIPAQDYLDSRRPAPGEEPLSHAAMVALSAENAEIAVAAASEAKRSAPKSRALSAAERAQQEAEARRIQQDLKRQAIADEKELEADELRYSEVDPQRRWVFVSALVVGIVIFATSALFSFPAVAHAAESMLPTWDFLVWVVPGFVEAFVIFFGIDAVIWQARAANVRYTQAQADAAQKSSDLAILWMMVFAGVGVLANWYSTFQAWGGTLEVFTNFEAIFGMALAALAPLSVVLITKRLTRLVFIYAVRG